MPLLLAASNAPIDFGPAPTFEQAHQIGEVAIKGSLIDPDSAHIEWPYCLIAGTLKPLFGKTIAGYYTCGFVNARNRMGGYTGRAWFLIMIKSGVTISLAIENPGEIDAASATCPGLLKKGIFSPSGFIEGKPKEGFRTTSSTPSGSNSISSTALGIDFMSTPAGATILAIRANSPAARAGLKPGETIEAVNGISIGGFGPDETLKAIQAQTPSVIYTVVGVGAVTPVNPRD